ncbi:class I SAM-dependent methyltransferase [Arthrobacter zhaoxinii]|uniref:class I SAM-dependent methyltransferase n=1 Tax=Arthrobacter zhaoxinii TaxID=2964616 RepID=UPI00210266B4|nr:class I SAM-dependent methyltransferase [Arthrobacter zhaoxinii]MCQ2001411.1 class I SAM-dependent methyltransferase [Arthrobacter zhaoxinii]
MIAGFPSLGTRAVDAVEEMDRPDADRQRLDRTYAQFWLVNAVVSGWRRNYVRYLRPVFAQSGGGTLLDIGSGGGDVPRSIARWARRDGFALEVTAIDPDPRAHAFASALPALPGLTFRRAYSHELVAEGRSYDVVISNHMLHHLAPAELQALLADSEQLARRLCLHSDIERSRWAYALFAVGTLPFFPGSFIRADGLTSIRRSFTAAELAAVTPPGWQGLQQWPWQNLLVSTPSSREEDQRAG